MADFDPEDWEEEIENVDYHHQNVERAPDPEQLLGPWTVIALMLNRTIGKNRRSDLYRITTLTARQDQAYL